MNNNTVTLLFCLVYPIIMITLVYSIVSTTKITITYVNTAAQSINQNTEPLQELFTVLKHFLCFFLRYKIEKKNPFFCNNNDNTLGKLYNNNDNNLSKHDSIQSINQNTGLLKRLSSRARF